MPCGCNPSLSYGSPNRNSTNSRSLGYRIEAQRNGDGLAFTNPLARPEIDRMWNTLPWGAGTNNGFTGISKDNCMYDSGYSADGCMTEPLRFPNLVTGFMVNPEHATRVATFTRYTSADWMASNKKLSDVVDCSRQTAEIVRAEAMRLIRETDDRSSRGQMSTSRKLGERLKDIYYWKSEIMNELNVIMNEHDKLQSTLEALERLSKDLNALIHIAQENLYSRESREGVDLVHDIVEDALMDEIKNIRLWQQKLCRGSDGFDTKMYKLLSIKNELERDLQRKEQATAIDTYAAKLNNHSKEIGFHSGIEKVDPTVSSPETWAGFTKALVIRAKHERVSAQGVTIAAQRVITQALSAVWSSWNATNNAFTQRIAQLLDVKNKIMCNMSIMRDEVFQMEKDMDLIRKAIEDKAPALKVAQTRFEKRTHRADIELCKDEAQNLLIHEIQDGNETLEHLQRKLLEVEASHQQLLQIKSCLETDLKVKANSLFIDREVCMGLRKSFPISTLITQHQTCDPSPTEC